MSEIEEIKQRLKIRQAMSKEERTLDNSLNILFKGEDDDIEYLLSRISTLEEKVKELGIEMRQYKDQFEHERKVCIRYAEQLEQVEAERERLSKLLVEARIRVLELEEDLTLAINRKKELENNIDDPEWCCTEHKEKLVDRIKKLEEAIEKFLKTQYPVTYKDLDIYKILREK